MKSLKERNWTFSACLMGVGMAKTTLLAGGNRKALMNGKNVCLYQFSQQAWSFWSSRKKQFIYTYSAYLKTYPGVSPCRCLHLSSSLYSGWPRSVRRKSQASSSTSSPLSHWLSSGLHSHRAGGTVHLHKHKTYITNCAAVCSRRSHQTAPPC